MSWITAAIASTILFSFCVLFDKFVGTSKIKSVYSFAFVMNVMYLPFTCIATYFLRNTFMWGWALLFSCLAGVSWFIMWLFYWTALQKGEASRVAAVFFTTPIWSAFIGLFFLNERLVAFKWVGIMVIVCGAVLSSLGGSSHKKDTDIAYVYALLAAIFGAIGNAISKYAMGSLSPFTVNCVAFYATLPLYLVLLRDTSVFHEVQSTLSNVKLSAQFLVRGLLGYSAIMLNMMAMGMGVVSLVSAIGGAQPMVILVLSLIASTLFPKLIHEELGKKTLLPKLTALILTVVGVVMISM